MRILIALCLLSLISFSAQAGVHAPPRHDPPSRHAPPPYPSRPNPPHHPSRDPGQCYLDRYPDICRNSPKNYCKDPAKHYREHGRFEGRFWGCR